MSAAPDPWYLRGGLTAAATEEALVGRTGRLLGTSVAPLRRHGSGSAGRSCNLLTCPRDGAPIVRRIVGGRASSSCPRHQI